MVFLKKTLDTVFVCGVLAFMTLGTIIVAVQFYSIMVSNGALAVSISKMLGKPAFIVATITGLIGFIQGYVNGWNMGD